MLDLTVERLNTDVLFCHAVMISPSSYGLKARIRNVLSKQRNKKGCKRKQSICLVQREQWKVKPWSEANVPFQYDVVKNKIRIKAYIGKEDVVSVPEKIEGKTVNEIQTGAFKNCNVKKITIPASVETIGNKMALKSDDIFKRCPKLKEVNTKGKGISDSRCNSYPATSRL